ncbi:unnamed protein product [Ambrosiozyma monospora]|uniref:Unnamed protein product n=1 Tax=Ambrosiozyma monospora TaxID=43982 RepID=A0ACB5TD80_AMBMO|nr:unnamed protein product [Ambrosiozyma monospora]
MRFSATFLALSVATTFAAPVIMGPLRAATSTAASTATTTATATATAGTETRDPEATYAVTGEQCSYHQVGKFTNALASNCGWKNPEDMLEGKPPVIIN